MRSLPPFRHRICFFSGEMALRSRKKILLIDEACFSRICSAILVSEGYHIETASGAGSLSPLLNSNELGLIITSYPYGAFLFEKLKAGGIPAIILSDQINLELINMLEGFNRSYCLIKPLDYRKFRTLVKRVMSGDMGISGGYNIV
jgi:DNA-binding NtrC family response regulator